MRWFPIILFLALMVLLPKAFANEEPTPFVLTNILIESTKPGRDNGFAIYIKESKLKQLKTLSLMDVRVLQIVGLNSPLQFRVREAEIMNLRNLYRHGRMSSATGGLLINLGYQRGTLFTGALKPTTEEKTTGLAMGKLDWQQIPGYPQGPEAFAALRAGEGAIAATLTESASIWSSENTLQSHIEKGLPKKLRGFICGTALIAP